MSSDRLWKYIDELPSELKAIVHEHDVRGLIISEEWKKYNVQHYEGRKAKRMEQNCKAAKAAMAKMLEDLERRKPEEPKLRRRV